MKITFDTAGKGFFARIGDLIIDRLDQSKRSAIESLVSAIPTLIAAASAHDPRCVDDGDIAEFYEAWRLHCYTGFEVSQVEADKLAAIYGVKAPPLAKVAS